MTEQQSKRLNTFFVRTYNTIQTLEERALLQSGIGNLSVKELHILEAVTELLRDGRNTMSHIAARLCISVGALTTAVNTMVRKGYLVRRGKEGDRRVVLIEPTETGRLANAQHERFHQDMIERAGEQLDEASLETLCESLDKLAAFFEQYAK